LLSLRFGFLASAFCTAPGLLSCFVLTLACSGVAVGSTIGHALGGFFGGGSAPAETQTNAVETQDPSAAYGGNSAYQQAPVCQQDVLKFRQCMDQNQVRLQRGAEERPRQLEDVFGQGSKDMTCMAD
jgi:hypothetical protein